MAKDSGLERARIRQELWQYDLIRNKLQRGNMRWLLLLALLAVLLLASAKASLVKVSAYDTPGYAKSVALSGSYAYVADGNSGLQIIDISNPASPILKGTCDTPGYAHCVALSGSYAYMAAGVSGLQIIDISNPSSPILKGTYNTQGNAYGVALSGSFAYVADDSYGLQIIDISNPVDPTLKGTYDTLGKAYGVALSGSFAYVADDSYGLQIIDISNSVGPIFKGTYNTPGNAYGAALSGSFAYVADGSSGLQIIDISNPASPFLKGTYDTPATARSVALSGSFAYVADGDSGLQILAEGAKLGDYVWHDLNRNGVQDSGEQPIATVTVILKNSTKTLITATNTSGLYQFSNLVPGSYDNLTFTLPTGYCFTLQDRDADNAKDSDVNPETDQTTSIILVSGQQDFTWDAGIYKPASISGTKFHDLDGDGTQDVGEGGLDGWKIYNDSNNDGGFQEGEIWATTDWNGAYSLTGLAPGTYRIREVAQDGWAQIFPSEGYHEVILGDVDVTGQDFGNIPSLTVVKVTDPAGSADRFTFQNDIAPGNSFDLADGEAKALHADPGIYIINEVGLASWSLSDIHAAGTASVKYGKGTSFAHDDFVMGDTGVQMTMGTSQYCRITFNNTRLASISGRIWDDQNYDGLQDANEPALTGIPVELVGESGDSLTPPQAVYTDGSGNYNFSPLPGRYKVMFTLPSGKAFSPKDQGTEDSKDSDADPTSGKTDVITIAAGQSYPYWDVGMYENMIVINEIYPNPIGNDNLEGEVSWERVELKNIGSVACNIGQWTIKDDDTPPILATIPSGTILSPGGYLVVHVGGPSRGINNSDGDPVILCNYADLEMDRVFCPISRSKEELSYSCLPDASDNWDFWGEPTLGGDLAQSSLPGARNLGQDLGDAPTSASTTRTKNGPRHFVTGLHLGFLIDYELNGRPTVGANGDDNAGQDDEDGVTFTYIIIGLQSKFNVIASAPGILQAWMDFNGDGIFDDPAECIASSRALSAGEQTITFDVPSEAKAGYTYARFRFSTASGLSPYGLALDGEVEDYRVQVSSQSLTKTSQSPKTIGDPEDFTIVSEFWGSDTYDNAIIVDTLPKGLRYVSYECNSPDSGQCIGAPTQAPGPGGSNIITWNLGNLPSSNTVSIKVHTIVENIPENLADVTLTNSVEASHDAGGQHYKRTATAQVSLTEPSLTLTKAANPSGPLFVGSTVPYTLTIRAESGATHSTAYELVLTDVLPPHLVYENSNPDASYDSITRTLTWHFPSLAPGATQTITYNAQVGPGATSGETLTNNAEVDWTSTPGINPDERSYTGTSTVNVNLDTSSVVTKARSDSGCYTIGDTVGYTVQTTLPRAVAKQVVITDTLPVGLIYVSGSRVITPAQPGSAPVSEIVSTPNDGTAPVTITWTFGDVDNSDNLHNIKVEFNTMVANVPANVRGYSLNVNLARLSWRDEQDVLHEPSSNSATIGVIEPGLTLSKSASPTGPVAVGSTVPYTLTVQAESGSTYSDAYDLVVTDVLPLHMSYVSSNPSGSYDPATRTITWNFAHLAMGDPLTIAYIAQIDSGVVAGDILINNAGVSWTSTLGTNPNERSYTQTSNSHVNLDTSSSLTKTLNGPASRTIGDSVGYTIQATLPAAIANNVVITDTLPKGLIYVPDSLTVTPPNPGSQPVQTTVSSPNDGTAQVTITWSFGDVDNSNNANFKIDFNATVANTLDNKAGSILDANRATMIWTDSNSVQHSPSANSVLLTVVPPKPEVKIFKIAKTTSASPGAEINFTLNITNTGNLMLQDLTITDEMPQGLSYVSDDHGGTVRGQTITWRFDLLEKEQTITINLKSKIDVGASGNLINRAKVDASDKITGQTVNGSNSTGITSKVPRIKVEKTVKLPEPLQYEQFCDTRTISGTGKMESTMSVRDTRVALEYDSAIAGEGDVEMDSVQAMSEAAGKLQRYVPSLNQTNLSNVNFYEASKVNFRGDTPLTGSKSIRSVSFHGGIGARIDEAFRVDQMEKNQTSYLGSTTNATQAHVVGMDTQSKFNGTMNAGESIHKMFDTKIESHGMFSGRFEIDRDVKLHQNATQTKSESACEGIDC